MMFQSYALWPHLTLAENVGFGLVERKVPKAEIRRRVGEALESVHLGAEADRKPNELSGGQQQRVALARALVIRPRCLLLDEPLSNLDAKLRLGMRAEIRRVCKEFKLTAVYVTHDQKEALSIADRMAVLDQGEVLQVGTPREVYRRPVCRTVAHFIGETDFIDGQVLGLDGAHLVIETPLGRFRGVGVDPASVPSAGTTVTLSIRPECWKLGREACSTNTVRGRIGNAIYLGEVAQYEFITGSTALKVYELNPQFIGGGTAVDLYASVDPNDVVVLQR
jgi:iron(III) transport system ATP-binding protein